MTSPTDRSTPGIGPGPSPGEIRSAVWSIGLMSGTALDGHVDAALLKTDGEVITSFGPYLLHPYGERLRAELAEAVAAARRWNWQGPAPACFAPVARAYTQACADAVNALLAMAELTPADIAAVGLHGQTVLHRAPSAKRHGRSCQLGDGALLARLTRISVVDQLRQRDLAAGGQGAPLAPVYHAMLMRRAGLALPAAVLNLGGVANITWWDGARLCAFDTGPANGPLNDWVAEHGLGAMDRDGVLAGAGVVDQTRLARMLDDPWFERPWPKSLDRYDFDATAVRGLSAADGAATLCAFAAAAVARGLALLPAPPTTLVLCGGGRHNPVLCEQIQRHTGLAVRSAEAVGWRGDAIEAELFACLAVRHLRGLPISFPGTTGVPTPISGGSLHRHREN
jgi:anhydro-N-acetylmuramic acid kinase